MVHPSPSPGGQNRSPAPSRSGTTNTNIRGAGHEIDRIAKLIPSVRLTAPYRKEKVAGGGAPSIRHPFAQQGLPPPATPNSYVSTPSAGAVRRPSDALMSRASSRGVVHRDSLTTTTGLRTPTDARTPVTAGTHNKFHDELPTVSTPLPPPQSPGRKDRSVIRATIDTLDDNEDSIRNALAPSQRHLLQHQAKYSHRQAQPNGSTVLSTGHGYVSSILPAEQARQQELIIMRMRKEKDHQLRRQQQQQKRQGSPLPSGSPKKINSSALTVSNVGSGGGVDTDLDDVMSRTTTQSEAEELIVTRSVTATRLLEAVNCDGALHLCSETNHWTKVHNAKEENLRLRTLQRMTACALSTQLHDQARLQQTASGYSQHHAEVATRKLELLEGKLVGGFERFLVNQHRREIAKHSHESRLLSSRTKEWLAPMLLALATRRMVQCVRVARAKEVLQRLFVGRFLSYLRKTKSRQQRAETVLAHEASIVDPPPLDVLRSSVPAMARLPEALLVALLQPMYPAPSRNGFASINNAITSAPRSPTKQSKSQSPAPQQRSALQQQPQASADPSSLSPVHGINGILAPRRQVGPDAPLPPPSPVGCGVLERRCFLADEFLSYAGEPGDLCFILYRGAVECPSETAVVRGSTAPVGSARIEQDVRGTTVSEDGGDPQTDLSEVALNHRRQLAYIRKIHGMSTTRSSSGYVGGSGGGVDGSIQSAMASADAVMAAPPLITARWSVICHSTLWTADPYEHTFRAASLRATQAADQVLRSPEASIDMHPPLPWLFTLPNEDGAAPSPAVGGADFWIIRQDKFSSACQRYFADQKINLRALRTMIDQQQLVANSKKRRQSMTSDAGTDIDSAVDSEGHSGDLGGTLTSMTSNGTASSSKGANPVALRLAAARALFPTEIIPMQLLERQLEGICTAGQWHIRVADAHRERIMLRHRNLTPETIRKASNLFSKFSSEGIRMLIQAAKPVVCRKDDVVIKPGQYGRKVLLIVAGRLEVVMDRRKRLQVLAEGSCVGDTAAALGRRDARVSVRALTSSDVWLIDHKDLDMVVVREDPAMLMTVAIVSLDDTGTEKVIRS